MALDSKYFLGILYFMAKEKSRYFTFLLYPESIPDDWEMNSEAKHKTVAEFKQEIAYKEIEQELVLDFGAPEYANNLGELVTKEEYQEAYEVFQNELGNLFGGGEFSWRETTFQEKLDWVKERQREEVERLAEARKPLEDEIRALNEFLREKYEEVDKIELRASESLSELSEAEGI